MTTFLLPAAARFGAQRWQQDVSRALGRADIASLASGRRAQLARHIELPGGTWPLAALSRQVDVGDADASDSAWLRADPAWLRPDINGVRLMAHGDTLGLTREDCDALLPALQPVFGDAGFALDAPDPARWYLRMPRASPLPEFLDPSEALGTDLADLADHDDDSAAARRWRALATEAQIILHNHPWNTRRVAAGRTPVNALWFWGGGPLPDARLHTRSAHAQVHTDDPTLHALAASAATVASVPQAFPEPSEAALFDLVGERDLRRLQTDWLQPAVAALARGQMRTLTIDDEDGHVLTLRRWHRVRVWRRPRFTLPAATS